jgi:hypothetical protein
MDLHPSQDRLRSESRDFCRNPIRLSGGDGGDSKPIGQKCSVPIERQGALAVGFVQFFASGWGTHHWADIGMSSLLYLRIPICRTAGNHHTPTQDRKHTQ